MNEELKRTVRKVEEPANLFGEEFDEPNWSADWWGMPHFSHQDARPTRKVVVNFMTVEDVLEFARVTGLSISQKTDTVWFPDQQKLKGEFVYDGPKESSRYPICIPSKGRFDNQTTGKILDRMGADYRFFVEETEADRYIDAIGKDRVVVMPFHDLGQGSIPARNFIWEWAKKNGVKRHWTVDDNIKTFSRCDANRRLRVWGGGFFRAMEDFVDRYENVAMAGPHGQGFIQDRSPNLSPFILNSRVYSCILLDTSLPHRWRGRYNEDTDLSLRLLKDGFCTMLFCALLMDKKPTYIGGDGGKSRAMHGGNTENVYNSGDFRRAFAESLRDQHPDVVDVVWRHGRWHHHVDYRPFKGNKPIMRVGLTPTVGDKEYGMELRRLTNEGGEAE